MPWLLDTNIAIHASEGHPRVLEKLKGHDGATLLSALCLAELKRGLHREPSLAASRRMRLELLVKRIPVIPFDLHAAECYGCIVAAIGWNRARDFDRMIAAHAQATNSVLVTDNVADFRDIPGLKVENWTAP
ncbi:MAG: type II toxin-antitoxin system VapC family toxin [Alphaproteobacteria bacterium]|nr:type II toxin-antitoxin system VapC family toxin [Alphaproteobacteria bacterium]